MYKSLACLVFSSSLLAACGDSSFEIAPEEQPAATEVDPIGGGSDSGAPESASETGDDAAPGNDASPESASDSGAPEASDGGSPEASVDSTPSDTGSSPADTSDSKPLGAPCYRKVEMDVHCSTLWAAEWQKPDTYYNGGCMMSGSTKCYTWVCPSADKPPSDYRCENRPAFTDPTMWCCVETSGVRASY